MQVAGLEDYQNSKTAKETQTLFTNLEAKFTLEECRVKVDRFQVSAENPIIHGGPFGFAKLCTGHDLASIPICPLPHS